MGRSIPKGYVQNQQDHTSITSLSLVFISMAATISFATLLCGVRFGRKPKPESKENSLKSSEETLSRPSLCPPQQAEKDKGGEEDYAMKKLPLPPAKQARSPDPFPGNVNLPSLPSDNSRSSLDQYITKSASLRNFKSAISLKLPRSMSVARTITSFKDKAEKKGGCGGGGKEESVWTKTIILGEKCKVPDEEDEEVVIRDGKGKRVPTFHPRNSSLLSSNLKDDQSITDQRSDSNNVNSPDVSRISRD